MERGHLRAGTRERELLVELIIRIKSRAILVIEKAYAMDSLILQVEQVL